MANVQNCHSNIGFPQELAHMYSVVVRKWIRFLYTIITYNFFRRIVNVRISVKVRKNDARNQTKTHFFLFVIIISQLKYNAMVQVWEILHHDYGLFFHQRWLNLSFVFWLRKLYAIQIFRGSTVWRILCYEIIFIYWQLPSCKGLKCKG